MANRIRKINTSTRSTVHVVILSDLVPGARIQGIDVSTNGTIYAADYAKQIVYKIYEHGKVNGALVGKINVAGDVDASGRQGSDGNTARLDHPLGICVDKSDNIYVGSGYGMVIRRVSPSGRSRVFAGKYATPGDVVAGMDDNVTDGSKARFGNPGSLACMGLDVDKAGRVYVADTANNKVKKLWESGKSTRLAGSTAGFVNAIGPNAKFNLPYDLCVDNQGNVYVADANNNRIRKVTESGVVTTLAGTTAGFVDGNGLTSKFTSPRRVEIDDGNQFLYVLDYGNAAIRRVDMHGNVHTFMPYNVPPVGCGDIAVDRSGFLYVLENDS
jgi:sugar lactone lactonase YvrE